MCVQACGAAEGTPKPKTKACRETTGYLLSCKTIETRMNKWSCFTGPADEKAQKRCNNLT